MPSRRRREVELERVLGTPALVATAYGNVGSSIYYALGLSAGFALSQARAPNYSPKKRLHWRRPARPDKGISNEKG